MPENPRTASSVNDPDPDAIAALKALRSTPSFQAAVASNVASALREDLGDGDLSAALIDVDTRAHATVITREDGVFCGKSWIEETCRQAVQACGGGAINITWHTSDGAPVTTGQTLFTLSGGAATLLTAERTVLNFAQLLCGTATLTAQFARLLTGTRARLLDTRKTVPGLRVAQKYAVRCGGGHNHRMGLFDAYLLKENHILAAGSIGAAVAAARSASPGVPVEVEVESLQELRQAIAAGANTALIDNFSLNDSRQAVAMAAGVIALEASGNVDENTIADIAATGVDYISVGALTKVVRPLDLSMRFR